MRKYFLFIILFVVNTTAKAQPRPCGDTVYRQFDFWIGEWEAFGINGKKAGDSNQEYTVQGPEAFTFDEAAKVFVSNCKKKISIFKSPMLPIKLIGMMNNKLNYAVNICEALNKYPEKFESDNTWNDLGKPNTTLAHYAASLKF